MKFRSQCIIYRSFVCLLIIYTFHTVLENSIIIPPYFDFEIGVKLGWASEIKEVSTQNVLRRNPFLFEPSVLVPSWPALQLFLFKFFPALQEELQDHRHHSLLQNPRRFLKNRYLFPEKGAPRFSDMPIQTLQVLGAGGAFGLEELHHAYR